jgi:tRNA pseudouridine55 synthase
VAAAAVDGVLLLDKPAGYSSTQALGRAKRYLAAKKAGHTGTLDPFATGLLPVVFGEATKFARFLIDATKAYRATLRLGVETTTGDTEGAEIVRLPVDVDVRLIDDVLGSFLGWSLQTPPMHSAVRIGGTRLYDLARQGLEIERTPRRIEITRLARNEFAGDELVIDVECSKGTYVRTLAVDIGRSLGCGAYLTGLRRTAVGPFVLENAATLEALAEAGPEAARGRLLPVDVLVRGLARHDCDPVEAARFSHGQELDSRAAPGTELAVFGPEGRFLGVGLAGPGARLAPMRLMAVAQSPKNHDFA